MPAQAQSIPETMIKPIADDDSSGQFSCLLDLAFEVPAGAHYFEDFPVWNPEFKIKSSNKFGIFKDSLLLAGAAVRTCDLKIRTGKTVPVALIGAVATHPQWRGRGLAS